jgi:hypothetical protein
MNSELLQHSLIYGVILSVIMSLSCLVLMLVKPEMWVDDYPPDIQEKFGPMSVQARQLKRMAGPAIILLFLGTVVWAMVQWTNTHAEPLTFMESFLSGFVIFMIFNLFDWLILDWLLFVTIQPRLIILQGTEGMAGYKDYAFHFYGFLKGIAISAVMSLIVAVVVWWV